MKEHKIVFKYYKVKAFFFIFFLSSVMFILAEFVAEFSAGWSPSASSY